MLAAIASATLIVAGSLIAGQAILTLAGRPQARAAAGPVGLAVLLTVSAIVAGLGGRGVEIAVALALVVAAGGAVLLRAGLPAIGTEARLAAITASLLAGLFAALPFIAAGAVGILGVGLVNDDMASHLLLADWIGERFRPEPVLIDQGYPLGPHALVAGLGEILGARSIDVFAGLTLAIPGLTAFVVTGALGELRPLARIGAAVVVSLPYLAAAYLAQEAFKEPIVALFMLAFALLLPQVDRARDGVALGVLAAGTVYVYSFPGLAWLAGVALVWGAIEVLRRRRLGRFWPPLVAALAVLAALALADLDRLRDFADFRALHPDRANEGGVGNLRGQLSPLEALGIWPTSEFRLSAGAGSLPAAAFYAGAAFALVALALALPRWIRRHGPAVPAALAAAAVLYLAARGLGTVYTSAKALAIAAPLVALIILGGLLASSRRALVALGAAFALAAALSSFLILRQAPVAPEAHMRELAEIRPLVEGEKLLFLGRDNFILYELRGSKPFTAVRNFYDPYYVKPNLELENVFAKFDFDSVTGETLARFPYVLTTRAGYASAAPPEYELVKETQSYRLWSRLAGPPIGRLPGEDDAAPGRVGGCDPDQRPLTVRTFTRRPVVASDWSDATIESGEPATIGINLGPGEWELSLQYDATRELQLRGPGLEHTLPGNLDYRGSTPFFPAGTIDMPRRGQLEITASVEDPPLAGRLLGADSIAHLGTIAATVPGAFSEAGSCSGYVDWYEAR
jgi:hypothetical protein